MSDREAAAEVKRLVGERIEALRERGYDGDTLTALIAREHLNGRRVMDQLKAEHRAEELARAKTANIAIYGAEDLRGDSDDVAHRASFRDAQDRAARVDSPDQAARLLAQAERSGDEVLARAVAVRAFDRRWKDVTESYSETRPEWKAAVDNVDDTRISVGMGANLVFGLRKPEELRRLHDGALETIVRDNEDLYRAVDNPPDPPSTVMALGSLLPSA